MNRTVWIIGVGVVLGIIGRAEVARAEDVVVSCRLANDSLRLNLPLRATGEGIPFAVTNVAGKAPAWTVAFPFGDARQGARVTVADANLEIAALVVGEREGYLAPARAIRVGKTVIAGQGAHLWWRATTSDGHLSVEARAPLHYRVRAPLTAIVSCKDVALGFAKVDKEREAAELPPMMPDETNDYWLAPKVDIPVSATRGGEAEGVLRFDDKRAVQRLEEDEDGDFVRVYVDLYTEKVYGWVPTSAIRVSSKQVTGRGGGGTGLGIGGFGVRGRAPVALRRCARGMPLWLKHDGRIAQVGVLKAGATLALQSAGFDFSTVKFPTSEWLNVTNGAELAVRSEDLPQCKAER